MEAQSATYSATCSPDTLTCTAYGGYGDCDDADRWVFEGATEICDGQYNHCGDQDYDAASAPDNELDDDGDTYVECDHDASIWVGDAAVTGGLDCDDASETAMSFLQCLRVQRFIQVRLKFATTA